jgi:hypothetical protein
MTELQIRSETLSKTATAREIVMKKIVGLLVLSIAFSAQVVYADRGSIPFRPNVKIFEPTQRALIAWNGEEEILLRIVSFCQIYVWF